MKIWHHRIIQLSQFVESLVPQWMSNPSPLAFQASVIPLDHQDTAAEHFYSSSIPVKKWRQWFSRISCLNRTNSQDNIVNSMWEWHCQYLIVFARELTPESRPSKTRWRLFRRYLGKRKMWSEMEEPTTHNRNINDLSEWLLAGPLRGTSYQDSHCLCECLIGKNSQRAKCSQ